MTTSRLPIAFAAATMTWALMLLAAPFVISRPPASSLGTALVLAVYSIGGLVCHQLPERSYRAWGAQMPVCARCAGIYFGAAAAALVTAGARGLVPSGARRLRAFGAPASLAEARVRSERAEAGAFQASGTGAAERLTLRARRALVLAVLPTVLTLVYEWTTGQMPTHGIRAAAGVPIGVVVSWLVVRHACGERPARPEPVEG